MTIEVRPLGVNCNLTCQYCYQNAQRDAGNLTKTYGLEKMKEAILQENSDFTLFGGEALLTDERDLEDLWAWGFEKFGKNSLQTNGVLINENHRRLFKKYNVHVGVSIDGPGALNDVRWAGTLKRTRAATARTERNIERLCQDGISVGLIVTLHQNNATGDKLSKMHEWFRYLDQLGIGSARLHTLEVEHEAMREKYELSIEENIEAHLSFARLEDQLHKLKFDIFEDMEKMLCGQDEGVTCIWTGCDPYTTAAVRGIEGDGQRTNCGRENKDGIDNRKADTPGFERYQALYHTPYEYGGCQGCRFFLMCKGQCPGTAIDGDWRNRTEHCEIWIKLFTLIEERILKTGKTPISLQSNRKLLEEAMLAVWATGENFPMEYILEKVTETSSQPLPHDQAKELLPLQEA